MAHLDICLFASVITTVSVILLSFPVAATEQMVDEARPAIVSFTAGGVCERCAASILITP